MFSLYIRRILSFIIEYAKSYKLKLIMITMEKKVVWIIVIVVLVIMGIYLYFSKVVNLAPAISGPASTATTTPSGSNGETGYTETIIGCGESIQIIYEGGSATLYGTGKAVATTKSAACAAAKENCKLDEAYSGGPNGPLSYYRFRCKTESCNIPDKCTFLSPSLIAPNGGSSTMTPLIYGPCKSSFNTASLTYTAKVSCVTSVVSDSIQVRYSCSICPDQEGPIVGG